MTFARTASGVANYNKFLGADIVIFAEGKTDVDEDDVLPDEAFYISLFKSINPKWVVKIKCVGNKDAALGYLGLVKKAKHKRSMIAIDKDNYGILSSFLDEPEIIRTYGYSWESDLFTPQLALDFIKDITRGNKGAVGRFDNMFNRTQRRLKLLSALDVSCQVDGKSLLPKSSKTGGVALKKCTRTVIGNDEVCRLIKVYRSITPVCPIVREVRHEAYKVQPQELIQGHIWENTIRFLISVATNNATGIAQLPGVLFLNLMLAKFNSNPSYYLGPDVYRHYRDKILARFN